MLAFQKNARFTIIASVYFIALGTLALPTQANDSNDRSGTRFATVLAQGQELRGGITSLFTVPNGIYGSFEHDGNIINFETRRGPRTPKALREGDPTTPEFEIDVRFMNPDGEPILVQIGGDTPFDHTWAETGTQLKSDTQAKAEFELASRSIEALKKLKFSHKFIHERQAILNLAPVLESAQVIEKIEDIQDQPSDVPLPLVDNNYRQKIQIHQQKCCFGLGRHSATIGKHISRGGVTTTAVITCNHGTCAHLMALKCSWTNFKFNRTKQLNNYVACSTPYNATSVFGHNSNDDTDLQYQAVRFNFIPSLSGGICNDSSSNNKPTNCY